jgi:hypothetical protein
VSQKPLAFPKVIMNVDDSWSPEPLKEPKKEPNPPKDPKESE